MSPRIVASIVLIGLATACTSAAPPAPVVDTAADMQAVRDVTDQELAAANAGDLVAFDAVLDANAVSMPPGEPAKTGAELREWLRDFMDQMTVHSGPYTHDEVIIAGDWAIHRYSFQWTITPKAGGDPVSEQGKGIHILRRQADGSWKIIQDVWNTNSM